MKKLLLVLVLVSALTIAIVSVASADGGPHGGFTPTADGCAGCHRAHTAQAPRLLVDTQLSLCYTCHGASVTGADTNVQDGVYLDRDGTPGEGEGTANRGLKAGGFDYALMNTDLNATGAVSTTVTSAHLNDGTNGIAWGNGSAGSGAGPSIALGCANCHDPHGNGNYRILRPVPSGSSAPGTVDVTDEVAKNYTIADGTAFREHDQYFGEGYTDFGDPGSSATTGMTAQYQELSDWCSQCHTRYLADVDSGSTPLAGDATFTYRHMAGASSNVGGSCGNCHDGVPSPIKPGFTYDDGQFRHNVECMTCHVAHGTSAAMGTFSGGVEFPDGTSAATDNERSSMLRVDSRGVCQGCHEK